jgi:hypothetical protein
MITNETLFIPLLFAYYASVDSRTARAVPNVEERQTCLRKLRHEDFLSALHHARRIDDDGSGSHVGHHSSTITTKLKRTKNRLESARQSLRTDNGTMTPAKRLAYENRIRDLSRREAELHAETRKVRTQARVFPPQLDWSGFVSLILINVGVWFQHAGCRYAARSKWPWNALAPKSRKTDVQAVTLPRDDGKLAD